MNKYDKSQYSTDVRTLIERHEKGIELTEVEIDKINTENDLLTIGTVPALSPDEQFRQYADYSSLSKVDKLTTGIDGIYDKVNELKNDFNAEVNEIRASDKYTEDYKATQLDEAYKSYRAKFNQFLDEQNKMYHELHDTKYQAVKGAYEILQKESNISKLTEGDIAYIVAMKDADSGDENRLRLAEKYNFNLDVLDLLNAGITASSLQHAVMNGQKVLDDNGQGSKSNRVYGTIISHPLEKAVTVFGANRHAPNHKIFSTKSYLGLSEDMVIRCPKELLKSTSNGII